MKQIKLDKEIRGQFDRLINPSGYKLRDQVCINIRWHLIKNLVQREFHSPAYSINMLVDSLESEIEQE